jgi:hypothetical protein
MRISRCIGCVLARPVWAAAALLAIGCQPAGPSPGSGDTIGAAAAIAISRVSCPATTAKATAPLPRSFEPVAVVRCVQDARGTTGQGLWRFEVKQRADQGLGAFVAALRRPSVRTPPGMECLTILYAEPSFVLVDHRGRTLRPALPVMVCGRPFPAAISRLARLSWVTVSVLRTRQLATRAELAAGCDPQFKDLFRLAAGSRLPQPSAGGPGEHQRSRPAPAMTRFSPLRIGPYEAIIGLRHPPGRL